MSGNNEHEPLLDNYKEEAVHHIQLGDDQVEGVTGDVRHKQTECQGQILGDKHRGEWLLLEHEARRKQD